ncbi:L,D-transpeptidase [Crossiella cryophila]|uniref:Lipoprotein-anchoring transpeptidase ErfK/SrfK n=1 Tax=Crossiella cryophila TaxID=43355 RepID=A0A7W7FST1_9PSEU|nr:L,D-transpeptidase [Crossiella cryophila]MBB4674079.1 lipoprotein-anchoring transpeptidase ErfK/SrfK [Crossiella cryophila]
MRGRKSSLVLAVTATFGLLLAACGTPEQPQLAGNTGSATSSSSSSSAAPAPSTSEPASSQPSSSTTKPAPATTTPPKPKPKPEAKKDTPEPVSDNATPCKNAAARACIDLSANKAWIMSEGKVVLGPVPITHGRKGWLTPPGTFKVSFKNRNHKSSIFANAPMPWSVFFNGGIAFHQGSLREKSHGCIHLSPSAAQRFFGHLSVHDIVQVVP